MDENKLDRSDNEGCESSSDEDPEDVTPNTNISEELRNVIQVT